jgi:hypothetical protein
MLDPSRKLSLFEDHRDQYWNLCSHVQRTCEFFATIFRRRFAYIDPSSITSRTCMGYILCSRTTKFPTGQNERSMLYSSIWPAARRPYVKYTYLAMVQVQSKQYYAYNSNNGLDWKSSNLRVFHWWILPFISVFLRADAPSSTSSACIPL